MNEKGMAELREILQNYVTEPRNLSLLTLHLYEVREGAQRYLDLYEHIFALPSGDTSRRDALLDVLIGMMVLMEDLTEHASELRKEIDTATDEIDKDDEATPP
jgi:hypothetical protein